MAVTCVRAFMWVCVGACWACHLISVRMRMCATYFSSHLFCADVISSCINICYGLNPAHWNQAGDEEKKGSANVRTSIDYLFETNVYSIKECITFKALSVPFPALHKTDRIVYPQYNYFHQPELIKIMNLRFRRGIGRCSSFDGCYIAFCSHALWCLVHVINNHSIDIEKTRRNR